MLSVGTDGEMNTRSVNVQNPFVNDVVSIIARAQGSPQKPCPSVRAVPMVNQFTIGKSTLSVGTNGEMKTRSVNVKIFRCVTPYRALIYTLIK